LKVKSFPEYQSDVKDSCQSTLIISLPGKEGGAAEKQEKLEESDKRSGSPLPRSDKMHNPAPQNGNGLEEVLKDAENENSNSTSCFTESQVSATVQTTESLDNINDDTSEIDPPQMDLSSRPSSRKSSFPPPGCADYLEEAQPFSRGAEAMEVCSGSAECQDQVQSATPSVVGSMVQLKELDPQYESGPNDEDNDDDELDEIEESQSIEEPTKRPHHNVPSRKHSRSSLRSMDFPGNSTDSRVSPVAHAATFMSSSPPTKVNSAFRSHPIASSASSSPHKQDLEVRLKRRDRHDHSPSRRSTSSPQGIKGVYSHARTSNLPPILNEYKNTIDKADKFERAIAALAESGSSDQDSDSEPYARLTAASLHPQEVAKVTEKMRAPPPSIAKHQVLIRKEAGEVSFGFSIADGQFDTGVYVKTVKSGGPSDRGGLQHYDRIIKASLTFKLQCSRELAI